MKQIILLLSLVFSTTAFAQLTSDSIKGTWVCIDNHGKEQKLVITNDSLFVHSTYQSYTDTSQWITIVYGGRYTIEPDNKIHVIFRSEPREESFFLTRRAENGSLQIVFEKTEKRKKVEMIYRRE